MTSYDIVEILSPKTHKRFKCHLQNGASIPVLLGMAPAQCYFFDRLLHFCQRQWRLGAVYRLKKELRK